MIYGKINIAFHENMSIEPVIIFNSGGYSIVFIGSFLYYLPSYILCLTSYIKRDYNESIIKYLVIFHGLNITVLFYAIMVLTVFQSNLYYYYDFDYIGYITVIGNWLLIVLGSLILFYNLKMLVMFRKNQKMLKE